MKHSKLMLLVVGATIIFFGCEKMEIEPPDLDQSNGAIASLKCTKVKRTFEGICTPVEMTAEINKWYDATDDWRVTGNTIWVTAADGFYGTAELIVDARNPHDENRGKWEMTWTGSITPTEEGILVEASAEGTGVEGKVKGLKANWTYTMDYVGADFPNPENPTFFYKIEGSIDKKLVSQKSHKNRH